MDTCVPDESDVTTSSRHRGYSVCCGHSRLRCTPRGAGVWLLHPSFQAGHCGSRRGARPFPAPHLCLLSPGELPVGTVTPALASDSAPLSTGWLPLSVPRCTPPSCPGPGRWACPGSAPRPEDPRRPAASAPRPAVYGRATALRAGSRRRGAVVTASLLAGALVAAERPQPQAACSFSGRSRSHQMATSTPVPQAVQHPVRFPGPTVRVLGRCPPALLVVSCWVSSGCLWITERPAAWSLCCRRSAPWAPDHASPQEPGPRGRVSARPLPPCMCLSAPRPHANTVLSWDMCFFIFKLSWLFFQKFSCVRTQALSVTSQELPLICRLVLGELIFFLRTENPLSFTFSPFFSFLKIAFQRSFTIFII
uniref:Translation initiation factor IF-2-like n=1 Tax=Camelus bactrianus TaxID=9837 RepID=A0A9W3FVF1_CAMBA|nr:translation initiation factor IF-2-like [Camelus bactrianus]